MNLKSGIMKKASHLEKLEIPYSQTAVYQKHTDEAVEVNVHHYLKDSHMFLRGSSEQHALKTYYIVSGKCHHLETDTILEEGDLLKVTRLNEFENIHMLEDTVFLIHSFHFVSLQHIEKKTSHITEVLAAIQAKDAYTEAHCSRVFKLTHKMALACGYTGNKMYNILRAARYHDIGKIFIDSSILTKPSKLTYDEYEIMKTHTLLGKEMIVDQFGDEIFEIVSQHHERLDGSGYPFGLRHHEIHEGSRILAICDSYDAMVMDRIYQKGKSKEAALEEIQSLAGTKYDPDMVALFVQLIRKEAF